MKMKQILLILLCLIFSGCNGQKTTSDTTIWADTVVVFNTPSEISRMTVEESRASMKKLLSEMRTSSSHSEEYNEDLRTELRMVIDRLKYVYNYK